MNAILTRTHDNGKQTIGILEVKDAFRTVYQCFTLEPAYINNRKNISCIMPGKYTCTRRSSPKYGLHFHVKDTPGRELILIHYGNYRKDTQGCILVGKTLTDINGDGMLDVTASRNTMQDLIRYLPETFELTIFAALHNTEQYAEEI